MYKIYINSIPLILCHTDERKEWDIEERRVLSVPFINKKHALQLINTLENSQAYDYAVVYSTDPKMTYKIIKSLFVIIKAAGGVVINDEGAFMAIYRRGKWDLPKGKRDDGEKYSETAIREVEEETGVKEMALESKLDKSYHVYRLRNGKRVLKITKWYLMTAPCQDLVPQSEEDIERAEWIPWDDMKWFMSSTYPNIAGLLNRNLEKIKNFVFSLR